MNPNPGSACAEVRAYVALGAVVLETLTCQEVRLPRALPSAASLVTTRQISQLG